MLASLIGLFHLLLDIFFHLDTYLPQWAHVLGPWLYVILFLVIFCETGLVVTPFLPGDSFLFAVGALAALDGSPVRVGWVVVLLIAAALLGDNCNYSIGRFLGPKVFARDDSRLLNKKHLLRTQAFYERHGGKTVVIARFMPIIRTFAPFVAGIGRMRYRRFILFCVCGAATWVGAFVTAGYLFGNIPSVKRNFQFVILAIIFISLLPMFITYWRSRQKGSQAPAAAAGVDNDPAAT
jgi:membrane-associated protein